MLEQRNHNLKNTIDSMVGSFLKLQAAAMKVAESHLSLDLVNRLQKSSDEFLTLTRAVYEEDGPPDGLRCCGEKDE
jgi:hypothetical protein